MSSEMISSEFSALIDKLARSFENNDDVGVLLKTINGQRTALNNFASQDDDLIDNWRLVTDLNHVFMIDDNLEECFDLDDINKLLNYNSDEVLEWCADRLESGFCAHFAIHFKQVRNSTIRVWCSPAGHGIEFSNLSINHSEQHHIQDLLDRDSVVESFEASCLRSERLQILYKQHVIDRLRT